MAMAAPPPSSAMRGGALRRRIGSNAKHTLLTSNMALSVFFVGRLEISSELTFDLRSSLVEAILRERLPPIMCIELHRDRRATRLVFNWSL
jgi:hypothetical protein